MLNSESKFTYFVRLRRKSQLDGRPFGGDRLRRPDRLAVDEKITDYVNRKFSVASDFEVERNTVRILKEKF